MTGKLLAAAALLVLTACDRFGAQDNAAGPNAADSVDSSRGDMAAGNGAGLASSRSLAGLIGGGNAADGGKDPAAIPAGAGLTVAPERLVGRWSDDGDCKNAVELRADGTFVAPNGAAGGWRLAGDELVLTGSEGSLELRVQWVDEGGLVTLDPNGRLGRSTRC